MNKLTKSRLTLLAVFALFAIPLIAAFVVRSSGWHPSETRNTGTLVDPPRDIKTVEAHAPDGSTFAWKDAQFHWTLVMLPGATCAANCSVRIDEALRMRITLGRNAERLRVVYVGPKQPDDFFKQREPLVNLSDPSNAFADYRARNDDSLALALVDPQGLLMMRYPDGYSAQGLRSDITKIIY
jgi:hypothetical protein